MSPRQLYLYRFKITSTNGYSLEDTTAYDLLSAMASLIKRMQRVNRVNGAWSHVIRVELVSSNPCDHTYA